MRMPGAPDPEYVRARRVLLDAFGILNAHVPGLILVGAQAVYLHTGTADFAVPEYTTDVDIAIAPDLIADSPLLAEALAAAGFQLGMNPGHWLSPDGVYLDLMVPEALAGPGRRRANLGVHGRRAARRSRGLEGVLVDRQKTTIAAFDPGDERRYDVWVAGPSALLVAKVTKIEERTGTVGRAVDKDALDVSRILKAVPTGELVAGMTRLMRHELSAATTQDAAAAFRRLFGYGEGEGVAMAVRAATPLMDTGVLAASVVALATDVLNGLSDGGV